MGDMLNKLKKAATNLEKALKTEGNLDLYKAITGDKTHQQVEKVLESLDKFVEKHLKEEKSDGYFSLFDSFVKKYKSVVPALLVEVEKTTVKEKNKNQKSQTYRALKVYTADINLLTTQVEQRLKMDSEIYKLQKEEKEKQKAKEQEKTKGKTKEAQPDPRAADIEKQAYKALVTLKQIGSNMEVGLAQGVQFCKTVMANPTHTAWNAIASDDGARRLSQGLTNLFKFVYTDKDMIDTLENFGKLNELSALLDPRVIKQVKELKVYLASHEKLLIKWGKESGKDAFDGSVAFLANSAKAHLPPTATAEDVGKAVKHFSGALKELAPVAKDLKKFGL